MFKNPTGRPINVDCGILACVVVLGIALMICCMCSVLNLNMDCVEVDVGMELVLTTGSFPLPDVCAIVEFGNMGAPSLIIYPNKFLS